MGKIHYHYRKSPKKELAHETGYSSLGDFFFIYMGSSTTF